MLKHIFNPEHDIMSQSDQYADTLTDAEIEIRDKFVTQYLIDHDPVKAAIRCGFNYVYACEFSYRWMQEPYVLRQIDFRSADSRVIDGTGDTEAVKKTILKKLFEETDRMGPGSSQSARVAALSKLMSHYGMDAPVKLDVKQSAASGVVALPPVAEVDDWSAEATATQAALKASNGG